MYEPTGKIVELMNLLVVFGTRPEAIKLAPLILKIRQQFKVKICVTGQHREMLDQVLSVFKINSDFDLNLMKPDQNLTSLTSRVLEGVNGILEKDHLPVPCPQSMRFGLFLGTRSHGYGYSPTRIQDL